MATLKMIGSVILAILLLGALIGAGVLLALFGWVIFYGGIAVGAIWFIAMCILHWRT
jgi:hypothetical protein